MNLSVILTTVANLFATSPDLCAEVYTDETGEPLMDSVGQTLSRYCEWTGPDAPVLDADICCSVGEEGASCLATGVNGRCSFGTRMYCEYGEVNASGGVVCYQPFPSACDLGLCVQPPEGSTPGVLEDLMCCTPGVCQGIGSLDQWDCEDNGGTVVWCFDGVSNEDGTVTCYDD